MRRKELSLFLFLLFIGSSLFSQNTKPAFSQLDVFELEHASDPQISPDGNSVVYVRNRMDIMKDQRMGRSVAIKCRWYQSPQTDIRRAAGVQSPLVT